MTLPALTFILKPLPGTAVNGTYGQLSEHVGPCQLPRYLPPGSLIIVRPCPKSTFSQFARTIGLVATRVVNAPILVWPDCIGRREATEFARRAWPLGVRAVVWNAEPSSHQLRMSLTETLDWPSAILLWLKRRGVRVPPDAASLVGIIADHALEYRRFAELTEERGPPKRTWYSTFAAAGLAPPGHWYGALRAVRIGIALQRNPNARMLELALGCGFSGASAMSDRLYGVVGARPSLIRVRLGWEWMLATALTPGPGNRRSVWAEPV